MVRLVGSSRLVLLNQGVDPVETGAWFLLRAPQGGYRRMRKMQPVLGWSVSVEVACPVVVPMPDGHGSGHRSSAWRGYGKVGLWGRVYLLWGYGMEGGGGGAVRNWAEENPVAAIHSSIWNLHIISSACLPVDDYTTFPGLFWFVDRLYFDCLAAGQGSEVFSVIVVLRCCLTFVFEQVLFLFDEGPRSWLKQFECRWECSLRPSAHDTLS